MARLLTYNYLINKYIFNNQICKYNNYIPKEHKSFTFNTADDVKNFIHYYHVKNQDFGNLHLADEITINDGKYNKTWLIAGFNTQLDSNVKNGSFGKPHITLVPKDYLFGYAKMHFQDDNTAGFAGTEMFKNILPEVNNNLSNVLEEYLLPQKIMLSIDNKTKTKPFTAKSMLLNHCQVFGIDLPYQYGTKHQRMSSYSMYINDGEFDNGDDVFQLPLFKQDVKYRVINKFWWLRNVFSKYFFTGVYNNGEADFAEASSYCSKNDVLRPFICIG